MTSKKPGKNISKAQVVKITHRGIWILVSGREHFLPYSLYPWFRRAKTNMVHHMKLITPHHLYWPALDVDLDLDSLEHPERYPLLAHHPYQE